MRMVEFEALGAALAGLARGEGVILVASGRPVARLLPLEPARAGRLPGWDGYAVRRCPRARADEESGPD